MVYHSNDHVKSSRYESELSHLDDKTFGLVIDIGSQTPAGKAWHVSGTKPVRAHESRLYSQHEQLAQNSILYSSSTQQLT